VRLNKMETEKLENAVVSLEDFITDLKKELSKMENQNKPILIPFNEVMKNKTTVEMFEEYFDLLGKPTAEEIVNEILEEPGKIRTESEVE
jgi:flagellar motor switch protein FliG